MRAVNELKSGKTVNVAAVRFDSRIKQTGLNYSATGREKQTGTKKKS